VRRGEERRRGEGRKKLKCFDEHGF